MNNTNSESGTTLTAPVSAPVNAQTPKIMVLAIHRNQDGVTVITPIDVQHDADDLTELTERESKAKRILDGEFVAKQQPMTEALAALYEIFAHRLYRGSHRNFENFCFSMYGTHRINDVLMKKISKKVEALKTDIEEES